MNTLRRTGIVWLAMLSWVLPALAAERGPAPIPHLDDHGQADYAHYLAGPEHRAFVIASDGTWAWTAEMPSEDMALEGAMDVCRRYTQQTCVPYAINDRVVFDAAAWPLSWGPYLNAQQAAAAPVGLRRGQRFPDIVFQSPSGTPGKLSDLRGKVVVLHFWGSWCPPCQREMPDLQTLHGQLADAKDIVFMLLPVREPLETAQQWAEQHAIRLPIAYGGDEMGQAEDFRLADGSRLSDRHVAKAFPTTYILDKHGVVVFSRIGPVARWPEFVPFLRDAAAKSGH